MDSSFNNPNYQKRTQDSADGEQSVSAIYLRACDNLCERINKIERERDEAVDANFRDPLTNCFNRNYLNLFDDEILNPFRDDGNLGAIFIDLDNFKVINDEISHAVGDELLKEFANYLKSSFRQGEDTVVRYGGDEFIVIYHNSSKDEDFQKNYENKIASVMHGWEHSQSQTIEFIEGEINVRPQFSVGFAIYDKSTDKNFDITIDRADEKMYGHKSSTD